MSEPTNDAHVVSALLAEVASIVIGLPGDLNELGRAERVGVLLALARRRAHLVAHLLSALGAWEPPCD